MLVPYSSTCFNVYRQTRCVTKPGRLMVLYSLISYYVGRSALSLSTDLTFHVLILTCCALYIQDLFWMFWAL